MSIQTIRPIRGTFNGLKAKIQFIRDKYRETLLHYPGVRQWAEEAAGRGPRRTQAERIFRAIRRSINYVGDPAGFTQGAEAVGVELIKAPWQILEEIRRRGYASGDCDDMAAFSYTVLKLLAFPVILRAVWIGGRPQPRHIYAVVFFDGREAAFDTTRSLMGQEYPYTMKVDAA